MEPTEDLTTVIETNASARAKFRWGEVDGEGAGAMDPCPLYVLGRYMQEGTWLDVRTGDGVIQRVRVLEIVVRVKTEEVRFRQEWLVDEEDFYKQEIVLDSEDIWRVTETNYHIMEVQPYGLAKRATPVGVNSGETETSAFAQLVVETVVKAAQFLYQINYTDLMESNDWVILNRRHACLLVVYEMTDLSPRTICVSHFKYRSQQPLLTARDKVRPGTGTDFEADVRRLGKLCDQQLLPDKHRRSVPYPRDYTPVLP